MRTPSVVRLRASFRVLRSARKFRSAECAKAYLSSLGALFEGDNPSAQASAVGEDLKSITDSCKKALAGP
jgi:hypothetical protein